MTNNKGNNDYLKIGDYWWERSVYPGYSMYFLGIYSSGNPSGNYNAMTSCCVCPAFCFYPSLFPLSPAQKAGLFHIKAYGIVV